MDGGKDLAEGLRVFDPDATSTRSRLRTPLHPRPPSTPHALVMATTEKVDPDSLAATDPKKAEAIYKSILQGSRCPLASVGMLNNQRR